MKFIISKSNLNWKSMSISIIKNIQIYLAQRQVEFSYSQTNSFFDYQKNKSRSTCSQQKSSTWSRVKRQKKTIWIKNFINNFNFSFYRVNKVDFNVDNKSTLKIAKNLEFHQRMKHIQHQHNFIRECITNDHINMKWINDKNNLIDAFIKTLSRTIFENFTSRMSMFV